MCLPLAAAIHLRASKHQKLHFIHIFCIVILSFSQSLACSISALNISLVHPNKHLIIYTANFVLLFASTLFHTISNVCVVVVGVVKRILWPLLTISVRLVGVCVQFSRVYFCLYFLFYLCRVVVVVASCVLFCSYCILNRRGL